MSDIRTNRRIRKTKYMSDMDILRDALRFYLANGKDEFREHRTRYEALLRRLDHAKTSEFGDYVLYVP